MSGAGASAMAASDAISARRPLQAGACSACGLQQFPPRLLCGACGSLQFHAVDASAGRVEQTTQVRHRAGAAGAAPSHLATVRTTAGLFVIAQLDAPLEPGIAVTLSQDGSGAIHAARA